MPLDVIVAHLDLNEMVPDWTGFYEKAVLKGWNPKTTVAKLEGVVGDVYGPEYLRVWSERMTHYLSKRGSDG